ncbi:flagellin [Cognatishimia maritima]|uniref:Flagellin n=1 Tax=Cognatishimia maritima TaxID=870908 RepID=A0A1M5VTN6_9RHOB|nr:flagellin [Cognatishimia maritima]SHH78293.1 flagellar hook-associated protein 3 FlgL [Cognatishimia maritima]
MSWLSTRMSTYQINYFMRSSVSEASLALQRAGQELSSGRRADMFGDLGPRAGIAITMRAREENTQSFLDANNVLEHKLDAMLLSVDAVRAPVEEVMQLALLNQESAGTGAFAIQQQARSALEAVLSSLNNSFNGEFLFSGTSSEVPAMNRWSEVNPGTGLSPEDVMAAIIGTGPTDVGSANAIVAELDQLFAGTHGTAGYNYEETFYNGTPELDGSSNPNERIKGRLDAGQELTYGIQANDPAFRDIIKGLAMLATVDIEQIPDPDAYKAWMQEAVQTLASGVQGGLDASANIGFSQNLVEKAKERLGDLSMVQRNQIASYENIDPYEVATRMKGLETQLQASYSVSTRLSGLSILNWYR